jgi:glycosyltransferase involved in cell wall biosynthesis
VREATDAPFLSVIIPTWNRAELLRKTLESLLTQDYPSDRWEIVVADDGSTDDSRAVTIAFAARTQIPIQHALGTHGGINAARNTGISAARGDAFVFLDDDEDARPGHLRRIAGHLVARPEIAGVGGPYRDAGDSRVPTCPQCELGSSRMRFDTITEVPELYGGNMTLRRRVIDEAGLFDTALSGRGDEQEWFRRAGQKFIYDPDLYILHRRDEMSLGQLCRVQFRQGRTLPRSSLKQGLDYRPRPARIPRLLAHTVRRWCARGIVLAARELGATYEWLRLRARPRSLG